MQLQSKYLIYNLVNFKVGLLMLYFKYIGLGKMCNIFITGMKRHPYKYKYSRITKTCILLYVSPFLLVITETVLGELRIERLQRNTIFFLAHKYQGVLGQWTPPALWIKRSNKGLFCFH